MTEKSPKMISESQRRMEGMLAGSFAGGFAKTATAPFDRVKILCQAGRAPNPWHAAKTVMHEEGWRGFFKGNLANVLRIVPNRGVLFMCSDFFKDLMRGHEAVTAARRANLPPPHLTGLQYVCAGSLSGAVTVLATYPLDLVRGRLAASIGTNTRYHGIVQTFTTTLKEEGFRALYRGMGPSLVGAFPYEGIRFGVYDYLKHHYVGHDSPWYTTIVLGALAGVTTATVLFPNDTVRRRMQVQYKTLKPTATGAAATTGAAASASSGGASGEMPHYKHGLDCYRQLYRKYGISVFYRGLTANLLRAAPSTALQFGSFEFIKAQFKKHHERS